MPVLGWLFLYGLLHGCIVLYAHGMTARPWSEMFLHLDSNWYQHIALSGYAPVDFSTNSPIVFFPLWPMLLRFFSIAMNVSPYVVGVGLSLVCLIVFLRILMMRTHFHVLPVTVTGIVLCLFAPGSWVYFSNHTEGLFLCLSAAAFAASAREKWVLAALLAGLCSITRNQGVILAASIGFANYIWPHKLPTNKRCLRFVFSGLISGAFYIGWLVYLAVFTGDPFASTHAQEKWGVATSLSEYMTNALWLSPRNGFRALWFWLALLVGFTMPKRYGAHVLPFSFYIICSVLLWPIQGHMFAQAYRFGAVIFPFWLYLGMWLEESFSQLPSLVRNRMYGLCYSTFIVFSGWVGSWYFLQTHWPY